MPSRRSRRRGKEELGKATALKLLECARVIADYAVANLPRLLVDDKGNVVWPEAFNLLLEKLRAEGREEPTLADVADVLEQLADRLDPAQVFDALRRIPDWKVKLAISGGMAAAKTILRVNPEWRRELVEKREELVLAMLANPGLSQAYLILKDRPNLLRFVTDCVLIALGVEQVPVQKEKGGE